MMCPLCNSPITSVPAGISKRTGKPYTAFQVCSNPDCKFKPVDEQGTVKEIKNSALPQKPLITKTAEDPYLEAKAENTQLLNRGNIMAATIRAFGEIGKQLGMLNPDDIITAYNRFIQAVEK